MAQAEAKEAAIRIAASALADVDLPVRLPALGLPLPTEGIVTFRAFGQTVALCTATWSLTVAATGKPARLDERILMLHYLLCDTPLPKGGEPVSFRDFPGGQFYLEPFLSRTIKPLLNTIDNNLDLLRNNLGRFDWEPVAIGDLGASIHAFGALRVILVYRTGDSEFPPSCDVLFSPAVKRVYGAEDAAALASRICIGLL